MLFLLVIAASAAASGPPTNHNAFEAFTARILVDVREAGNILAEPALMRAPTFPLEVQIERCTKRDNREVRVPSGAILHLSGHDCIIEVWPNADPPYRTAGFFRNTGYEWEYYGPVREVFVPSPSNFAPKNDIGRMITKPGSINYDGTPADPFNEGYDPYQALFDEYDRRTSSKY